MQTRHERIPLYVLFAVGFAVFEAYINGGKSFQFWGALFLVSLAVTVWVVRDALHNRKDKY